MRAAIWRSSLCRLPRHQRLRAQNRNFSSSIRCGDSSRPSSGSPTNPKDDSPNHGSSSTVALDSSESAVEKVNTRVAGGRRLARGVKTRQGIPPPPPIPDWFLKHNVRLYENSVSSSKRKFTSLDLLHHGTAVGREGLLKPAVRFPISPDPFAGLGTQSARGSSTDEDSGAGLLERMFGSSTPTANSAPSVSQESHADAPTKDGKSSEAVRSDERSAGKDTAGKVATKETSESADKKRSDGAIYEEPRIWTRVYSQCLLYALFSLMEGGCEVGSLLSSKNLILHSPDPRAHAELDKMIEDLADLTRANIVRIDANDIAELAGQYIDGADHASGSISSLPYDAYEGTEAVGSQTSEAPTDSQDDSKDHADVLQGEVSFKLDDLRSLIDQNKSMLGQALGGGNLVGINLSSSDQGESLQLSETSSKSDGPVLDHWQELKLEAFLDSMLSTPKLKESSPPSSEPSTSSDMDNFLRAKFPAQTVLEKPRPLATVDHVRAKFVDQLSSLKYGLELMREAGDVEAYQSPLDGGIPTAPHTIVHLRDIDLIRDTPQGDTVLQRLIKAISKRRAEGERIVLVGTSTSSNIAVSSIPGTEDDDLGMTTITVPTRSPNSMPLDLILDFKDSSTELDALLDTYSSGYPRLLEINLRNIHSMILQLGVPVSQNMYTERHRKLLDLPGATKLGKVVLTSDQVQRIVLFAHGLRALYTTSTELELLHIALAVKLLGLYDQVALPNPRQSATGDRSASKNENVSPTQKGPSGPNIEQLKRSCSKHEQRLLGGVVDPQNIKTTFADVHAPLETIEALKTVTSLSLSRPEAFSYGVLANDRLPGLLLYGPPGTGKTLLAKAVAKESGATVLEVSGAQVYEKYVGEGEKMVKAVFSLARKLSPCVVFIDEADALFGSRSQAHRTTHREIINQFLREWDGMDDRSVFIMVATNRPFDLDDAVLRRLPRRLLVDLPVAKDRESILKIHLKGETLDDAVSPSKLAGQTPFYSGSDLKNLCVAAALTAVREENELLVKNKEDKEFKLPKRRTLTVKHFERAIQEISASISEDMSSLNAIKKFDEQFGDRRGRKKKSGYGFGNLGAEADEGAARVRRDEPKP